MATNADPRLGLVALSRFGLGSRGDGDIAAAASDPKGFLRAELASPGIALLAGPSLPRTAAALQAMFADQAQKKAERERLAADAAAPKGGPNAPGALVAQAPARDAAQPAMQMAAAGIEKPGVAAQAANPVVQSPSVEQVVFRAEALARIQRAVQARAGLVERLVAFWSNHFCISANKSQFARITAGAFEREAIRPHVLGRFSEMLRAVEGHPGMLHFLDNAQSAGPLSRDGQRGKRGLNENLAREILELHTLGVGGGYGQADVTNLARIITGWTLVGPEGRLGEPGTFVFNVNAHEPGPQILLGRTYAQEGISQGEAALADLARHPSTATFIATKFARHFVADEPPRPLVDRLAQVFRSTDGDLKALTQSLIDSDEAWQAPLTKMRSPYEFLIAVNRALGRVPDDPGQVLGPLNVLGMPLWAPPGPNGFPDIAAPWSSPEGMKLRLDFCSQLAAKVRDIPNPSDLLEALCGAGASPETRDFVARAESKQQGLAMLLMSREFQRR